MTDRSEKKRQMFVRMLFTNTSKHAVYTSPACVPFPVAAPSGRKLAENICRLRRGIYYRAANPARIAYGARILSFQSKKGRVLFSPVGFARKRESHIRLLLACFFVVILL